MTVPIPDFVARVEQEWRSFGNVVSDPFRKTWSQIGTTMNRQIELYGTPEGRRYRVLQPATGTGKSLCTYVYAAMLPHEAHPGMLYVTRLTSEADRAVRDINALAGRTVATAFHSDHRVPADVLAEMPVVAITHRAYEIGLDAINKGDLHASHWDTFTAFRGGKRKLVVVDEALDIVDHAQIDEQDVRLALALIPHGIGRQFPAQMEALRTVSDVMVGVAEKAQDGESEKVVWRGTSTMPTEYDMTPLRKALRGLPLEEIVLSKHDTTDRKRVASKLDGTLKGVHTILERWAYYSRQLASHTLNSARLIVPDDAPGAVILDATASQNLIYRLFNDRADLIPVPSQARQYDNVTIHASWGHHVGKGSRRRHGREPAEQLVATLEATLPETSKVLVVTHKSSEHHVTRLAPKFARFEVAHWGAIDGVNEWKEFDTVAIFSLPSPNPVVSANTFMAFKGLQDDAWLQTKEARSFQEYTDVRHSMDMGIIVVQVVQAINRVRCRTVIDEQGNCPPTNVFLLLPADGKGKAVLKGIEQDMPGVQVRRWSFEGAKRKVRTDSSIKPLVSYLRSCMPGVISATEVRQQAGISSRSFKRLLAALRDGKAELVEALSQVGVSLHAPDRRPGARASFIKV